MGEEAYNQAPYEGNYEALKEQEGAVPDIIVRNSEDIRSETVVYDLPPHPSSRQLTGKKEFAVVKLATVDAAATITNGQKAGLGKPEMLSNRPPLPAFVYNIRAA